MLSILRLAIRNIGRGKVRSILVVLILGVVLGLGLVIKGVNANIEGGVRQIRQSIGNIIMVNPPGSFGIFGFGGGETLNEGIVEELRGLQHINEVVGNVAGRPESTSLKTPSFAGGGMDFRLGMRMGPGMGGAIGGPLVFLNGIATGQPLSTFRGGEAEIISGRNLTEADDGQNVALIGETLATENGLEPGLTFTLNEEEFSVVGIFTTGTRFGGMNLFLPLASAQRLLGLEGQVTSITVTVDSLENVESTLTIIQDQLGDRADVVSPLTMMTRFIGSTLEGISSTMETGADVTLIVAAIVVFFTMLLVVRESTREIGTLKAIGASNTQVLLQFSIQTFVLTLIGVFLAIVVYLVAGQAIANVVTSIGLSPTPRGGLFGVEVSLAVGISYLPWAVLSAIIGGLLPSLYAARLNPAEVLRHG